MSITVKCTPVDLRKKNCKFWLQWRIKIQIKACKSSTVAVCALPTLVIAFFSRGELLYYWKDTDLRWWRRQAGCAARRSWEFSLPTIFVLSVSLTLVLNCFRKYSKLLYYGPLHVIYLHWLITIEWLKTINKTTSTTNVTVSRIFFTVLPFLSNTFHFFFGEVIVSTPALFTV